MNWRVRLIFCMGVWFIRCLVFAVMALIGLILVPVAALCGAYAPSGISDYTGVYHFTWPFMKPWDNVTDGIANNSYSGYTNMIARIFSWSAIRNPVYNMKTWTGTPFSCLILSEKITWVGSFSDSDSDLRNGNIQAQNLFVAATNQYDDASALCPQWFVAFQDLYAFWYWIFSFNGSLYRVMIGFNIYPTFIFGVTPAYSNGSGFSITPLKKVS